MSTKQKYYLDGHKILRMNCEYLLILNGENYVF